MLSMLVGMKDSSVKLLINDLAACQDKKKGNFFLPTASGEARRKVLFIHLLGTKQVASDI